MGVDLIIALLVIIFLVCGVWAVVAAGLIAAYLEKNGQPVNVFWMRLMIFRYLSDYIRLTRAESGRVGPLFFHYVIPLNIALLLVIAVWIFEAFFT